MPATTIKVDSEVRDRLAQLARNRGTTLTAMLAAVAEQLEREQYWADLEVSYARYRSEDPEGWDEYLSELALWDAGIAEPDMTAREEWPELNA